MSVDQAKAIYRKRYWDAQRCDELPAGVDYSVFDYSVNSGVGRSGKVLRRVVGLPDDTSIVTDQVLTYARVRDPKVLVAAICDERLAFLQSLKTWPVFGRSWGRRVAEVKAVSLALAGKAQGVTPSPAPVPVAGTPPWLARMNAILGLYEFPGSADNPAIVAMARACGGNIARTYKHDATPCRHRRSSSCPPRALCRRPRPPGKSSSRACLPAALRVVSASGPGLPHTRGSAPASHSPALAQSAAPSTPSTAGMRADRKPRCRTSSPLQLKTRSTRC
jgi:hypothetical protein